MIRAVLLVKGDVDIKRLETKSKIFIKAETDKNTEINSTTKHMLDIWKTVLKGCKIRHPRRR